MSWWYNTGTANVTSGSATVTGSGTAWKRAAKPGQALLLEGSDRLHQIRAVPSDTEITLVTPFAEASVAGAAYEIVPIRGEVVEAYQAMLDLRLSSQALTVSAQDLIDRTEAHLAGRASVADYGGGAAGLAAALNDPAVRFLDCGGERITLTETLIAQHGGIEITGLNIGGNVSASTEAFDPLIVWRGSEAAPVALVSDAAIGDFAVEIAATGGAAPVVRDQWIRLHSDELFSTAVNLVTMGELRQVESVEASAGGWLVRLSQALDQPFRVSQGAEIYPTQMLDPIRIVDPIVDLASGANNGTGLRFEWCRRAIVERPDTRDADYAHIAFHRCVVGRVEGGEALRAGAIEGLDYGVVVSCCYDVTLDRLHGVDLRHLGSGGGLTGVTTRLSIVDCVSTGGYAAGADCHPACIHFTVRGGRFDQRPGASATGVVVSMSLNTLIDGVVLDPATSEAVVVQTFHSPELVGSVRVLNTLGTRPGAADQTGVLIEARQGSVVGLVEVYGLHLDGFLQHALIQAEDTSVIRTVRLGKFSGDAVFRGVRIENVGDGSVEKWMVDGVASNLTNGSGTIGVNVRSVGSVPAVPGVVTGCNITGANVPYSVPAGTVRAGNLPI